LNTLVMKNPLKKEQKSEEIINLDKTVYQWRLACLP